MARNTYNTLGYNYILKEQTDEQTGWQPGRQTNIIEGRHEHETGGWADGRTDRDSQKNRRTVRSREWQIIPNRLTQE